MGLTNSIIGIYSKTFGLTFINDDHYYSIVAIFQNLLNGVTRIFWGLGYDRQHTSSLMCINDYAGLDLRNVSL